MSTMESSQMIKPCRVQITDLRKLKHLGTELGKDAASTSMNIGELVVDNDGWIMDESSSSSGKDRGGSGRGTESELDDSDADWEAFYEDEMCENSDSDDDEEKDGDWKPNGQTSQPGKTEVDNPSDKQSSDDAVTIDTLVELTPDILKRIMNVVYCVENPNEDTLLLLKEQMEERPKLKLKLLKDLQLGKTMFREKKKRRGRAKQMYRSTPTMVEVPATAQKPQLAPANPQPTAPIPQLAAQSTSAECSSHWNPHQPLTLALASAHLAAQRYGKGDSVGPGVAPRFRLIAPKSAITGNDHPTYRPVIPTAIPGNDHPTYRPVIPTAITGNDLPKYRPVIPTAITGNDLPKYRLVNPTAITGNDPKYRPVIPTAITGNDPKYRQVIPNPPLTTGTDHVVKKDNPKLRPIAPKTAITVIDHVAIKNDLRLVQTKGMSSTQVESSPLHYMNETLNIPTQKSTANVHSGGGNQTLGKDDKPQTSCHSTPKVSRNDTMETQDPAMPSENIKLLDKSQTQERAIFMPEKRTVHIPHLAPCPPNTLDVLVPVDAHGQMKPPFMAIPLDSCKMIFSSTGNQSSQDGSIASKSTSCDPQSRTALNERNNNKSSPLLTDDAESPKQTVLDAVNASSSLNQPGPSKSRAKLPGAGVFPSPQLPTHTPTQDSLAPKILPPPALPPGIVPPGMVPVGLVPPGAFPPGRFPVNMLPPGVVPMTLPPHALSHPHAKCTCPHPAPPPVLPHGMQAQFPRPQVAVQPEQDDRTRHDENKESNMPESSTPKKKKFKSSSPTRESLSSGIQISSVRSCASADAVREESLTPGSNHKPPGRPASLSAPAPETQNPKGLPNPGSLLTVFLPKSAEEHYKRRMNSQKKDPEVAHAPVSMADLGLVWNDISYMKNEIMYMKTVIASEINDMKFQMDAFMGHIQQKLAGFQKEMPGTSAVHGNCSEKRKHDGDSESENPSNKKSTNS